MEISRIIGDRYMERFKVFTPSTLFDPDLSLLKENRCILCGNKLKFMRNGKSAFCSSVKHRKSFIISVDKLEKCKLLKT